MDEKWAQEGPGFEHMELYLPRHDKTIKVANSICMDINPYKFEAPFDDFEFANFVKNEQCQLIMFSSNWCDPNSYPNDAKATHETINYWGTRLSPIIEDKSINSNIYFVCANRVGVEEGVGYMGSSCVIQLRPKV